MTPAELLIYILLGLTAIGLLVTFINSSWELRQKKKQLEYLKKADKTAASVVDSLELLIANSHKLIERMLRGHLSDDKAKHLLEKIRIKHYSKNLEITEHDIHMCLPLVEEEEKKSFVKYCLAVKKCYSMREEFIKMQEHIVMQYHYLTHRRELEAKLQVEAMRFAPTLNMVHTDVNQAAKQLDDYVETEWKNFFQNISL